MEPLTVDALIVGNGFDLYLGMKTSYGDFHKILSDAFHAKAKDASPYVKKWNAEGYLCTEERGASILFYLIFENKDNFFVQYFSNAKYQEWNDFEKELEKIYKSFDIILSKLFKYRRVNSSRGEWYYLIDHIYEELPTHHIFEYISSWRDFILRLDDINYDKGILFDKTTEREYEGRYNSHLKARAESLKVDIPKWLFEDLRFFCSLFTLYLNAFTYKECPKCQNLSANYIFTYNYTDAATRAISSNDTLYLHGKFNYNRNVTKENLPNNLIVFGIDDKCTFINDNFNRFKKTIIRSLYETDIKRLGWHLDDIFTREPGLRLKSIGILGHSLDLIDRDSLEMILQKDFEEYYVFFYNREGKIKNISNMREILGVEKYNLLFNNGKITFIEVNQLEI